MGHSSLCYALGAAAVVALCRVRQTSRRAQNERAIAGYLGYIRDNFSKMMLLISQKGALHDRGLASFLRLKSLPVSTAADAEEASIANLRCLVVFLQGDAKDGGLRVGPSTIEGAGDGLFVTRAHRAGDMLCVYRGTALTLAKVLKMSVSDRDYTVGGFGLNLHIDAKPHPHIVARFINDNFRVPGASNAKFVKIKQDKCALVVATRDLAAGEEIFISYGDGYWRARGLLPPEEPPPAKGRSRSESKT